MTPSSFLRHPAAIALRLLLWPAVILLLSNLVASTEDDGLGAGLLAFLVVVALAFLLSLGDGLVLRTRPLLLVWSVTTVVLALLLVAQPVLDHVLHGSEWSTWAEAVQLTLEDLPSELAFFLVMVGVPVGLGALAGSALRRSVRPRPGAVVRAADLGAPRG
ncbi:hypothetical protein GCM10022197_18460 [Microlunatus spumicola]|uniref:Uncharacterized protein n=1 Tax=Microlunatus spumicola TaxID=81499 RepID=A0ABP6XAP8_9ACTN